MLLTYTCDLHGNIALYQQVLELASRCRAQIVAVGGDLLPPGIRLTEAVAAQQAFIVEQLYPLLAAFHADYPATEVYLLPGNDDWAAAIAALTALEQEGLIRLPHGRACRIGDNSWLAGYACVPLTPYSIKDYERRDDGELPGYSFAMAYISEGGTPRHATLADLLRRPTLAEELASLVQQSDPAHTIYLFHAPPFASPLDLVRGRHRGSRALRSFIEHHQPPLTLHGHIHEAPRESGRFAECIGTTWCINPGHEQLRLSAVCLDTEDIEGTLWHTLYGNFEG